MAISRKTVEHIAHLARIHLTEEEKAKHEKELSGILEFVEQLNEVNTDGVLPTTGGTELENAMREDAQKDALLENRQAEMMSQVPERKDFWVKVKQIFD